MQVGIVWNRRCANQKSEWFSGALEFAVDQKKRSEKYRGLRKENQIEVGQLDRKSVV